MNPEDIQYICDIVKARSGIVLNKDKLYLLESRLLPVARSRDCSDLPALVSHLRKGDNALANEVAEAMTTNESSFFRDIKPFEQLRKLVLPRLLARPEKGRLRIWSAACSNGQEPYSIALCLQEEKALLEGREPEIIATDIAPHVLERARQGAYSQFEVQRGMPIQMLLKYFSQMPDNQWQIKEPLRRMVMFRIHNLLHEATGLGGAFDIIFCRNVLIYFDEPTKQLVLERIARVLKPHGILFLGSTETILGLSTRFKPLEEARGIYTWA